METELGERQRAKRKGLHFGGFYFQLLVTGVCALRAPGRVVPGEGGSWLRVWALDLGFNINTNLVDNAHWAPKRADLTSAPGRLSNGSGDCPAMPQRRTEVWLSINPVWQHPKLSRAWGSRHVAMHRVNIYLFHSNIKNTFKNDHGCRNRADKEFLLRDEFSWEVHTLKGVQTSRWLFARKQAPGCQSGCRKLWESCWASEGGRTVGVRKGTRRCPCLQEGERKVWDQGRGTPGAAGTGQPKRREGETIRHRMSWPWGFRTRPEIFACPE